MFESINKFNLECAECHRTEKVMHGNRYRKFPTSGRALIFLMEQGKKGHIFRPGKPEAIDGLIVQAHVSKGSLSGHAFALVEKLGEKKVATYVGLAYLCMRCASLVSEARESARGFLQFCFESVKKDLHELARAKKATIRSARRILEKYEDQMSRCDSELRKTRRGTGR